MSAVHAVAQAVASVTPSPSPSSSPVVHAATQVAVSTHSGVIDVLNALVANISQADVIAAAAVLAVLAQSLLNRFSFLQHDIAWVQNVRRQVVALALPFLGVLVASFASGQNTLHLAPVVYLVGQVVFYTIRTLQGAVSTPASAQLAQVEPIEPTEGVG